MLPNGNMRTRTAPDIGQAVRQIRHALGVTQEQLALTSGTNRRFVVDLEKGKPTCHLGKVLRVLQTLGATVEIAAPRGIQHHRPADKGD